MRERIADFFNSLFSASGKELGGLLVLGIVIILGIAAVNWLDNITTMGYENYQVDRVVLDSLIATMEDTIEPDPKMAAIDYFLFNPNTAKLEELLSLGLDSIIAARIIKYRNKGGVYRQKSDLQKIYGLTANQFEALYNYIELPVKIEIARSAIRSPDTTGTVRIPARMKEEPLSVFDINLADTSILQTIQGIGPVLASRIVSFREKLGGFVDPNQLYQVYYLDSIVVDRLKKVSIIAPDFVPDKIKINLSEVEDLAAHPYISWNQARLIVAYRSQHGAFSETWDFTNVYSIDEPLVQKITPYVTFVSE